MVGEGVESWGGTLAQKRLYQSLAPGDRVQVGREEAVPKNRGRLERESCSYHSHAPLEPVHFHNPRSYFYLAWLRVCRDQWLKREGRTKGSSGLMVMGALGPSSSWVVLKISS